MPDIANKNAGAANAAEQTPVVFAPSNIRPFDITRPAAKFNFTAMRVNEDVMKRAHIFSICGEPL